MLMTSGVFNLAGRGSIAHNVPKKNAVLKNDWHRDVALQPVQPWRIMIAEILVLGDVIDDDRSAAIANFVANRRLNIELTAWQKPKCNFVADGAGYPAIPRHSRHGRKAHSGGAAEDFQN